MMEFNTQICTNKEQSKRLIDLGLNPNTADCYHYAIRFFDGFNYENTGKVVINFRDNITDEGHFDYLLETLGLDDIDCFIPAWSLHRLIYMLPNDIEWMWGYIFNDKNYIYDNIIDFIEWLIIKNYFNKEYLKKEE